MTGRVISIISNLYIIKVKKEILKCSLKGKFRLDKKIPLVGDLVLIDEKTNCITKIFERKNELIRPRVSNVDQVIIILSVKDPEFSTLILDKFLAIIEFNKIKPIICLTKLDLLNKNEFKKINIYIKYYRKLGYKVINNKNLFKLKLLFKNKITVFTGQSGVGKSTLLNKLRKDLNLKTNEVSQFLKRGKHTTKNSSLYEINNGLVCDTPGFSSLDLIEMTPLDIRDSFIEFNSNKCKYKDCLHLKESGCNIKKEVEQKKILKERYENYKKIIE